MKIVIEYVLIESFIINFLTLKTVSLITHEKSRLIIVCSILGAVATVCLPLLKLSRVGMILFHAGLFMIYIAISFKFNTIKKAVALYVSAILTTMLYGGVCYFLEFYFGIASAFIVATIVGVTYLLLKFVLKIHYRKKNVESFCYDVEIETFGRKTKWRAFLDTGNLLYDPLTDSPVVLINYKVFSSIFENVELEDILTKSSKLMQLECAHYISLNTLNKSDKILAFQVDKICVDGGKTLEKPILGLTLNNFSQSFGTDIILHNNFAV